MSIPALPTSDYTDTATTWGTFKGDLNAIRDTLGRLPGVAEPVTITIASGQIAPTSGDVLLETESGGSLDQLTTFDLANLPEYRRVRLRIANAAHVVDLVHLINAGAGGGELVLHAIDEAGGTLRLDSLTKSVEVERRGDQVHEVQRFGFGSGGIGTTLDQDLDGQGHTVRDVLWNQRDAAISGGLYAAATTDRGDWLDCRADATVTLPNPNITGSGWAKGATITWMQHGSLLRFLTHTGSTPTHPLNHDRAMGSQAIVQTIVYEANDGTLGWRLAGETAVPPSGGVISRAYAYKNDLPTKDLPVGSTAFVDCGTFTHTPVASSKYLYFCDATFSADAVNTTNNALCRIVNTAAPTTALTEVGRTRQSSQEHRLCMLWGASYSSSPSAQTHRIEAANGSTAQSTRVEVPQFFALKLETNEDFAAQSGVVADTNQTYDTVATLTIASLPADDYVILGQFAVDTTTDHRWSGKITKGGVDYCETAASNINPGKGLYTAMTVLACSGTTTFTVAIKSGGAGGTATATHGIIAVLRKSRFQAFDYGQDTTESTLTTLGTLATKLSKTTTLQSGWRSLVLGQLQTFCDADAAGSGCATEFQRNGATLGPDAEQGIRLQTGQAAAYCPSSFMAMAVLSSSGGSDTFALKYASQDSTAGVKVKEATILALALASL